MSTAPKSDEVLWQGSIRSVVLGTFLVALLFLVAALPLLINPFVTPDERIEGWAFVAYATAMVLCAVLAFWISWVEVQVRRDGLYIGFGPTAWPRQRLGWARVAQVQRINVRPTEWGGWGYRWVPWRKATAIVLRKGPGLRFDLAGDRVFVITLDDSANALAAVDRALHPESEHHCDHDHH